MGGLGQIEPQDRQQKLYIPSGRESCKIVLTIAHNRISRIEPGPAFDQAEWQQISEEIDNSILQGPTKVARDISFSSFRVDGSWGGEKSGVQILPPPPDAPRSPVEIAEHPFILEFPIKATERWVITNFRRIREHRRITLALNALLNARFSVQPRRPDHLWATLQEAQKQLSYSRIIDFVCRAIVACTEEEAVTQQILERLPDVWQERGRFRSGSTAARALELILRMPVITVKLLAGQLGVTLGAANQGMRRLEEAGVVRDRSGRGRGRSYAAEEVIGILARPFGVDPEIALQGARSLLSISPSDNDEQQ